MKTCAQNRGSNYLLQYVVHQYNKYFNTTQDHFALCSTKYAINTSPFSHRRRNRLFLLSDLNAILITEGDSVTHLPYVAFHATFYQQNRLFYY